jgi:hypothetical protein
MAKSLTTKDWTDIACALGVVLVLGLILTILSAPMASEGFKNPDVIRCDVYTPCPGHLKCINGFCARTDPVPVRENEPAILLPDGQPYPYPEEN